MITLEKTLQTEDLFDGLEMEKEEKHKEFLIKSHPSLEFLVRGFEKVLEYDRECARQKAWHDGDFMDQIVKKVLEDKKLRNKDIQTFIVMLKKYQYEEDQFYFGNHAGHYLNGCIEHCVEDTVILNLRYLDTKLWNIGNGNKSKKIIIYGNIAGFAGNVMKGGLLIVYGGVGDNLGKSMLGGEIHIHGNAEDVGRHMSGGKIIVEGDAGNQCGASMTNGEIVIKGNVGDFTGASMVGGEIYIHGNASNLIGHKVEGLYGVSNHTFGGKIYLRGKLIVENGRRIG